ncbi:hypothetical protein [Aquisalibacillus elongatus]|uniref:Uncharacterized protein n=1 Tax=Aquisalibacillus elongatus TaxID=485577 RepID=A0A3N5BCN0_9BACI|nr:hypothetical protein [Aquisalibacillus elongatus]RPF55466.1 hypothetical protein EDC24_0343 [Aquisalibacillus elongatus]
MNLSWLYVLYAIILAFISVITGEIVTFIMLGFVIITLQNVYSVLKEILHELKAKNTD